MPSWALADAVFQTGDLGLHLLADGETGGVITSPVDPEAGRQLLQGLGDSAVVHAQTDGKR